MPPTLHLNRNSTHRILKGHPWIFQGELDRIEGEPVDGGTVIARDARGKLLGSGIYNNQSQILFRRYSLAEEPLNAAFLENRIRAAINYRRRFQSAEAGTCERLVWSESDGLPGLIVDRYDDVLVLQTLTLGMGLVQNQIVSILAATTGARCIVARNEAQVRQLEGLPLERSVLVGTYEAPTRVKIAGVEYQLDLWNGQKTGFYLDQSANYTGVAAHARGRRVLDLFTNQGGFALTCLAAGATSCVAVDQSEDALALAHRTASSHGWKCDWIAADVFDWVREATQSRGQFDLIILDPPSFAKNKNQLSSALRGYHDLHVRALRLLAPGGLLATFSCSHHVDALVWRDLLAEASTDARCSLREITRFSQAPDHPVLPAVPETEYLRGSLLEKMP